MFARTSVWLVIGIAGIQLLNGCGGGADGRVEVSGTVEADGKPLAGANVAFIGGGGGALATASTDKDGKFRIRVATGENKVSISKVDERAQAAMKPQSEADSLMGTEAQAKASMASAPKAVIAERYADPETSGLKFDIQSGMAPISISISSK